MNKEILKKCVGSLMASLLLATLPTTLVGAETTNVTKDQDDTVSSLTNDIAQLNEMIFLTVKKLTDQGMNPQQLQSEIQNMLNTVPTDVQQRGQNSMSLRGFYGNGIFSCRGFA
jgi:hypothetical protein